MAFRNYFMAQSWQLKIYLRYVKIIDMGGVRRIYRGPVQKNGGQTEVKIAAAARETDRYRTISGSRRRVTGRLHAV